MIPLKHVLIHEHPQEPFAFASGLGCASLGYAFRSRCHGPGGVHLGACAGRDWGGLCPAFGQAAQLIPVEPVAEGSSEFLWEACGVSCVAEASGRSGSSLSTNDYFLLSGKHKAAFIVHIYLT